jgi:phosphotransferase system HPr (HPr) family protein
MSASSEAVPVPGDSAVEKAVVLAADLHARPAGQVTRAAVASGAPVWLTSSNRAEVDARSVLAVMSLGAVAGDTVRVRATGPGAAAAVRAVAAVLAAAEPAD